MVYTWRFWLWQWINAWIKYSAKYLQCKSKLIFWQVISQKITRVVPLTLEELNLMKNLYILQHDIFTWWVSGSSFVGNNLGWNRGIWHIWKLLVQRNNWDMTGNLWLSAARIFDLHMEVTINMRYQLRWYFLVNLTLKGTKKY